MKPTLRQILFAIIILVFAAVPVVHAVEPSGDDFSTAEGVVCGESPVSYARSIDAAKEVDYYSIALMADQVLIIDVDTEDNGATLDSLLEVFDNAGTLIAANDRSSEIPLNEDPYLEFTAEVDGTYYIAISAASAAEGDVVDQVSNIGPYTLLLKCTDAANPPTPLDPIKIGDLLGATGLDPASLLSINPADAASTIRFPLEHGKIADVEFDPASKMLFVAIDDIPGSIIAFDPNTGAEIKSFNYEEGGFLALESAEDILFGIYVDFDWEGNERYSLVTIDQATGATSPVALSSGVPLIRSLAYDPSDKILYGSSGADLIKFDLISSPGEIQKVGSPDLGEIVALDFSHENVLYSVDLTGALYKIPDLTFTNEPPVKVGSIISATQVATVSSAISRAPVSGLTFVVGQPPEDEEPVKTICSSSFTSPDPTSSEIGNRQLTRFRLRVNPLHSGIGMFKFQGKAQETLTLRLDPEDSEPVETETDSKLTWLKRLWSKSREEERIFVGIRDAIPGVKFRAKDKGTLPLEWTVEPPLPADGWYYIMVIRPLRRFQDVDYCLSLESDDENSQAWQTLDVVWPDDDSTENTASSVDEQNLAEPLTDDAAADAAEQTLEEPTIEATEEPAVLGAPSIAEETTTVDESSVVAPENSTEEPAVLGAPSIAEETTTVDESGVVAPENSTDGISGQDESAETDTSDVAGEDPLLKNAPPVD